MALGAILKAGVGHLAGGFIADKALGVLTKGKGDGESGGGFKGILKSLLGSGAAGGVGVFASLFLGRSKSKGSAQSGEV